MASGVRFLGGQHREFGADAAVAPEGEDPPRYPDQHVEGVPSRDLSNEEWEALAPELREAALQSGLYQVTASASRVGHRADDEQAEG